MSRTRTVVVSGALANKCLNGGEAWVRLSWALGLRRLGFDVCFLEQIAPETCRDADGNPAGLDASLNRAYFTAVTEQFGLDGSAALVREGSDETVGLAYDELVERVADAELLVNISGHLTIEELKRRPRARLYVDLDPGFTQFWHEAGVPGFSLEGHDHYATVGANIGAAGCPIPTGGLRWHPVRPPVLLDQWRPAPDAPEVARFTTVATWRSAYGPIEHEGKTYGLKVHEFRKLVELPRRAPSARFEIALDIHPGDREDLEALHEHGWEIVDPRTVVADPDAFRAYVQGSAAEFSVAQGVYVGTRSGWFSDRTAAYLASGRPALIQDTGLGDDLAGGAGLLVFRTIDEAVAGAEAIVGDYEAHSAAARALAERHLDSDEVLGRLLAEVGVAP